MTIAIVCEGRSDTPLELIGKAKSLSPDVKVVALAEGEDVPLEHYFSYGADEVIHLDFCEDDCAQGTNFANALSMLMPDAVLFPATIRGRFLSAWVAAKLETGLTADCTALSLTTDGLLLQSRPAFGGNLTADILCRECRPQMASVRPGVFIKPEMSPGRTGTVNKFSTSPITPLLQRQSFMPTEGNGSLQSAKIIVAGGKGVGSKRGFEKLSELAALLGGAVGATRGAVDAGYIDYAHQIGQTGVTVRPDLYFLFGASGLVQHIVGMNGAKTVIAVNADRNAPIFSYANYAIIADWEETANKMIQYLLERKKSK